jgi:hypothetical protein
MTLRSLKKSTRLKTHCCQQHWLGLKKVMARLINNEKKTQLSYMIIGCLKKANPKLNYYLFQKPIMTNVIM